MKESLNAMIILNQIKGFGLEKLGKKKYSNILSVVRMDGKTIRVGVKIQGLQVHSIELDNRFASGIKVEWGGHFQKGSFTDIDAIAID